MDKALIYEYTTLTAVECSDMMIDNAREYVLQTTMGDEWATEQFLRNGLFWDWWSYSWHQRDKSFLEWLKSLPLQDIHVNDVAHILGEIKLCYIHDHSVENLLELGIKPHRILEEKIFKTMVNSLTKEVQNG